MPRIPPAFSLLLSACLFVLLAPAALVACDGPEGVEVSSSEKAEQAESTQGPPPAGDENSPTWKALPGQLLRDQKFSWLCPFRPQRSDLPWLAATMGATAGLLAIDRPVAQELSDTPPGAGFAFSRRVGQFGGGITVFGVAGAFYAVGRWRGDERARTTGLLAMRAVANSLIIVEILKTASQRPRPTRDHGRQRNHNADGEFFTGGRSFPSGHAAGAWALATVVSHQYRHRRWVTPLSYSLAGLVAVARITERKHFPADVFVGSVLGYLVGAHVSHLACEGAEERSNQWRLLPQATPGGGAALTLVVEF